MDDGTVEEEKESTQPNRIRNRDNNSERKVNWCNKGTDQIVISDKGHPREYKKHRKNWN
jgi:hypothetical protein